MNYFTPDVIMSHLTNGSAPAPVTTTVNISKNFKAPDVIQTPIKESVNPDFSNNIIESKPLKEAEINFNSLVTKVPMEEFVKQQFAIHPVEDPKDVIVYNNIPDPQASIVVSNPLINNPVDSNCNGRKISNWFTRMVDQRGENFIVEGKLTTDEVNKNVDRIIDDIIAGRIDYSKQGKYIIEPIIIDTIIDYCANKVNLNTADYYTQSYFYSDYVNSAEYVSDQDRYSRLNINDDMVRNIARSMSITNRDIGIYTILYNKFMAVKNTKNAMLLISLINELNNYRKLAKNNSK